MVGKSISEEVRSRFPRLTMSLVMAVIFYLINTFVPGTMGGLTVPGLNINAGTPNRNHCTDLHSNLFDTGVG